MPKHKVTVRQLKKFYSDAVRHILDNQIDIPESVALQVAEHIRYAITDIVKMRFGFVYDFGKWVISDSEALEGALGPKTEEALRHAEGKIQKAVDNMDFSGLVDERALNAVRRHYKRTVKQYLMELAEDRAIKDAEGLLEGLLPTIDEIEIEITEDALSGKKGERHVFD